MTWMVRLAPAPNFCQETDSPVMAADLLDDFSTTNLNASKPTGSSGSGPSTRKAKETQGSPHKNMDGEQLTRELEAGLAGMIDVLQKDVRRPGSLRLGR